ncbi:kinase-like domain-containing protein [Dichotomocladium elegans]|nr:kinase-like domain-containing protein [Dichotomocladium elegans]
MSNALLLRLFTSEFFNSWIAISYLFRYPDNVGIQHYLCRELKKFPISEIEFFLPQLIHLLISRPTESVALECFLVEMCERSTHMAIMSLWYLQAYISDLSAAPNSPSFELCKRVLNKCQAIVFSENNPVLDTELADASASLSLGMATHRVRENVMPAVVGIGVILAGIGQPLMTRSAGDIAIAQGRRSRLLSFNSLSANNAASPKILSRENTLDGSSTASIQRPSNSSLTVDSISDAPGTTGPPDPPPSVQHIIHESHYFHSLSQPDLSISSSSKRRSVYLNEFTSSPSLEDLHRGKAFSVSRYIKSAHQKINSKLRPSRASLLQNSSSDFDPKMAAMGQSSVPVNSAPISPTLSQFSEEDESSEDISRSSSTKKQGVLLPNSPIFFGDDLAKSRTLAPDSASKEDKEEEEMGFSSNEEEDEYSALSHLSREHQRSLLRSNYFRSEMQFLLALVDIATRLVIVPKEARTSALNAELTLLNHNLPAEICIPLWCPATAEKPHHHRVVRISPSDAVVLNSAERAPYLLMIEVLDDELNLENDSSSVYRMRRRMKHKGKQKNATASLKVTTSSSSVCLADVDVRDNGNRGGPHARVYCSNQVELPHEGPTHKETEDVVRRHSSSGGEYAERMRTAAIMLAQLQQNAHTTGNGPSANTNRAISAKSLQDTEEIRQRIIKEMMALEEERMAKMRAGVVINVDDAAESASGGAIDNEQPAAWVVNKEDPSAAVFSEDWETKKNRIRAGSPYGHLSNWQLLSVIVKHGSDLRQEQFAIQLIREMQRIWQDTGVNVWVKYFRVLVTSDSSGLIETIRNAISIHSIKKQGYARGWNTKGTVYTLHDHYERHFGPCTSDKYIEAQDAFMRSLAGYSIACYLLQIKDRHNGNILIDDKGHLIHIDFGFFLSNSPGSVGFENAPFKLPQEYIDILGGVHGEKFAEYKALVKLAFLAVRKHCENIMLLVEMMQKDSKLPCFRNGDQALQQLRERFQLQLTEPQVEEFVDKMIMSSCCNVFTRLYDTYQYYSQVRTCCTIVVCAQKVIDGFSSTFRGFCR